MSGLSSEQVAFLALFFFSIVSLSYSDTPKEQYVLVGVSGTLQDGFELRDRLDYEGGAKARFVGKALVRGYKAYLDVKRQGCREYKASPSPPKVPNAVVSKCSSPPLEACLI